MSSRVLTIQDGGQCQPLEWPAVARQANTFEPEPEPEESPNGLVAELQANIHRLEAQGAQSYDAGVAEGLRRASDHFERERTELLGRLLQGVTHLTHLRATMQRDAEQDLVRLSLAIARRILRRELSVDSEALLGIARAAIERLSSCDIKRIRTHPALLQPIRTLLGQRADLQRFEVEADASLQPGDLLFDTNRGVLDASVDTQLREIETGLVDRLENN